MESSQCLRRFTHAARISCSPPPTSVLSPASGRRCGPSSRPVTAHAEAGRLVGVIPARLGCFVVDVHKGGASGVEALREALGAPIKVIATRREGGCHVWHRAPDNTVGNRKWQLNGAMLALSCAVVEQDDVGRIVNKHEEGFALEIANSGRQGGSPSALPTETYFFNPMQGAGGPGELIGTFQQPLWPKEEISCGSQCLRYIASCSSMVELPDEEGGDYSAWRRWMRGWQSARRPRPAWTMGSPPIDTCPLSRAAGTEAAP